MPIGNLIAGFGYPDLDTKLGFSLHMRYVLSEYLLPEEGALVSVLVLLQPRCPLGQDLEKLSLGFRLFPAVFPSTISAL